MSKKSERSETEPLLEDLEEERMPKIVRSECNLLAFITRRLEEFRSNFLKDYIPMMSPCSLRVASNCLVSFCIFSAFSRSCSLFLDPALI